MGKRSCKTCIYAFTDRTVLYTWFHCYYKAEEGASAVWAAVVTAYIGVRSGSLECLRFLARLK